MKTIVLILISLLISLGALAAPPVAIDFEPISFKETKRSEITLKYMDEERDLAESCSIEETRRVKVIEPCACQQGICTVLVGGAEAGEASVVFTVTAGGEVSNPGRAIFKILPTKDLWIDLLGLKGLLLVIGGLIFLYCYTNSIRIFNWIDEQTYGSRDYILKKFEIMFIEVDPQKITWALLTVSFGFGILTFCVFAFIGKIYLAIVLGIVVMVIGWKLPKPLVDYFENRRKKRFQVQMVDALNLMANGLRAGLSLPQAIGMVVDELPAPISQEFNLVLQQSKIGVSLDEALENFKKRIYTEDNEMFVTSVNILRETGANLAETFDTIVSVIRERVRLQLKIDTYIASGKIQAYIIGAMPFLMIIMFGSEDPDYFPLLFGSFLGIVALIIICGMVAFGMWVIMKIIDIKV